MKICLAQTRSVKGNIEENIVRHRGFIERAVSKAADMVVFPELSITGYEPGLAAELATSVDDQRLNQFQEISTRQNISIVIGLPVKNGNGVSISLLIFQPGSNRQLYSKKYLHADEAPFFISGQNLPVLEATDPLVALAICYELSVPGHAALAAAKGAGIYIASVAKTAEGMDKAGETLPVTAMNYAIPVLLVNCTGPCDNFISAGRSAAWNSHGQLLATLEPDREGILVFDSNTGEVNTESW